jgi:hypothetical protein
MSVYVRELLFDAYSSIGITVEEKCDIEQALQTLLRTGEITVQHVDLLRRYVAGYSIHELEVTVPHARSALLSVLNGIERVTGYTDERILMIGFNRHAHLRLILPALRTMLARLSVDLERTMLDSRRHGVAHAV